ncbi:DUF4825 domain-containing protein [Paraclostridium ghonii]|uniref:DUF4825 domain-containing protein n=1 Tax=Paraclostridium ghonii TaxID=29358 RepID=A0ABU0MXX5_9FIRM|nr:DUF4825 domain-containing protein [Paeniclostridium ghonii]MDQ0555763.1 hypothetical protein [Paeniclostridium ghonii]
MKYSKLKISVLLAIMLIGIVSIIGCNKTHKEQADVTLGENVERLLKYKNSYIGDNSAVGNISNYLLANDKLQDFELKTNEKPYEITLKYKGFEDSKIIISTNETITLPFSDVMIKNSMVLFSLIKNVDIINLEIDDGSTIIYKKVELVGAYGDKYGKNLEKITENKTSLENFLSGEV